MRDLRPVKADDFRPHLEETFHIEAEEGEAIPARLVEVLGRKGESVEGAQRTPFSIILRGPKERVLPQQIYRVRHEALGELELFLVTVGPDQHGMCYEAVFS